MRDLSPLDKISDLCKQNRRDIKVPFPALWTSEGIRSFVNPYDELESVIQKAKKSDAALSDDIVIYSAFVRTAAAYDFDEDRILSSENTFGLRETGTILRMLFLLPLLKRLGITMLYLLPIMQTSRLYKKGSAPSPYSVKNFYQLDPLLYDPMTGPFSEEKLALQFQAFTEAAHRFGIKVLLDFIPRTASRDNELILEHPDWFYWIQKDAEADFQVPVIPSLESQAFMPELTELLYTAPDTEKFLKQFSYSPDKLDKEKWDSLVKRIRENKIHNFLNMISEEFGIVTVPGFSDVINDPQPVWSDVTFLRLFSDHPKEAQPYLDKNQPPYVLFDVIKASRVHCENPNQKLWDYVSGILPYYQKTFSIDGVRIDMGHALPSALEKQIMNSAEDVNKEFYFIAEELDIKNAEKARQAGYHAVIGNLWHDEPAWRTGAVKTAFEKLSHIALPVYACSEMPDTPRTAVRDGKKDLLYFSAVLNYFLPHTIPFINTGFELGEIQPMNTGLDSTGSSLTLLPKKDLNYGKLAFFDYTALHWDTRNNIIPLMEYCAELRRRIYSEQYRQVSFLSDDKYVFGFIIQKQKEQYLILVNSHLKKKKKISFVLQNRASFTPLLNSYLCRKNQKECIDRSFNQRITEKKNAYSIVLKKGEISILALAA